MQILVLFELVRGVCEEFGRIANDRTSVWNEAAFGIFTGEDESYRITKHHGPNLQPRGDVRGIGPR